MKSCAVACEGGVGRTRAGLSGRMAWLVRTLLIVGLVMGCQLARAGQSAGVEARSTTAEVSLILRADKESYVQGEPLGLTLDVVNHDRQALALEFPTSQRYDVAIQNAQGQEVWRWAEGRMFAQMLGQETLPPNGGQLTYRVAVRDAFSPGTYTVIGVLPAVNARMTVCLHVTIR